MSVLGIITARGGSKGIPQKNIRLLNKKPLIAWTIEAALQSDSIEHVIVSTDDDQIADIAIQHGAIVPFMRPSSLAQDNTPHIPVIKHALESIEALGRYKAERFMLLQPTSPFRSSTHIDEAVMLAKKHDADSVISVCEAESHPYFCKKVNDSGHLVDFVAKPDGYLARQNIKPAFVLNGAIYLCRWSYFMQEESLYSNATVAYVMDKAKSIDIDTLFDWEYAEFLLSG